MSGKIPLAAWLKLSRPQFHTVGLLPFSLGAVIAYSELGHFQWGRWLVGLLAVASIMLATYLAGEYFDFEGDLISSQIHGNQFAGGSKVLPHLKKQPKRVFEASIAALALAALLGLVLRFVMGCGPWSIALGLAGMIGGFFYSTPPLRWVSRGIGELWIAFCYGWLAVAAGYYICTGKLETTVHLASLPVSATIFSVILLNEFPDAPADLKVGKRNLVIRLGKKRATLLFALAHIVAWASFAACIITGLIPAVAAILYLPAALLSAYLVAWVLSGGTRSSSDAAVERACGANIAVNLMTTAAIMAGFLIA